MNRACIKDKADVRIAFLQLFSAVLLCDHAAADADHDLRIGIAQVLVIAVGGGLIMAGRMDYIDLISFSLYVSAFVSPMRRLTQFSELYKPYLTM